MVRLFALIKRGPVAHPARNVLLLPGAYRFHGQFPPLRPLAGRLDLPGACSFHVLLFHFAHEKVIESGADHHDRAQFADLVPARCNRRREDIGGQLELNCERQVTRQRQSDLNVIFELMTEKRTTKAVDGDDHTNGNHERRSLPPRAVATAPDLRWCFERLPYDPFSSPLSVSTDRPRFCRDQFATIPCLNGPTSNAVFHPAQRSNFSLSGLSAQRKIGETLWLGYGKSQKRKTLEGFPPRARCVVHFAARLAAATDILLVVLHVLTIAFGLVHD